MLNLRLLLLVLILGITSSGCTDEERHLPITAKVAVSIPGVYNPNEETQISGSAPIIKLQTVELAPTPCYQIQHSKLESMQGVVHITLGDVVNTLEPGYGCADVLAPATATVYVDALSPRYHLYISLRDSTDYYQIEIDSGLVRLVPIELSFTIPLGSISIGQ